MTMWSNPLHVDAFPAVRRMEAEVVRMCISMFNGDAECCGTVRFHSIKSTYPLKND